MRKGVKILGVVVLSMVTLCAAFFCVAYYMNYQYEHTPRVDFEWLSHPRIERILTAWHHPATNDTPAYVEVCYTTGLGLQCYRIEGNRVVNYHHISTIEKLDPSEMQIQTFNQLSAAICAARNVSWPLRWHWISPFVGQFVGDVPKATYDSNDNEDTIFSCIISNMTAQIRQFETDNMGYVSMTVWEFRGSWEAVAYPLDEVPPVFKELHEVFEQCMADPSTREYHTTYIRGYPIPPPENPDCVPVLNAWKPTRDSCPRQRDILQFLMELGRVLLPIQEGVNPFKKFGVPYVPGNSLIINYRNEDNDDILYLHGDNFWRVQVYGGEEPSELGVRNEELGITWERRVEL